jgi:hypothetical protein
MNKRTIIKSVIVIGLAAGILTGVSLWSKVSFRARLYSTTAGAPPINVKIDIEEYSPAEDIQKLSDTSNKGDEDGFYRALRAMSKGSLQFIGGLGLNIKLNVIQEQSTEKGLKIFLLTESRSVEPGAMRMKNLPWRFLVAVLELDKDFNGEGLIYEDAVVNFLPQGIIEMKSSYSAPKSLVNIKLVK